MIEEELLMESVRDYVEDSILKKKIEEEIKKRIVSKPRYKWDGSIDVTLHNGHFTFPYNYDNLSLKYLRAFYNRHDEALKIYPNHYDQEILKKNKESFEKAMQTRHFEREKPDGISKGD